MNDRTDGSIDETQSLIRELASRLESQESELEMLRARIESPLSSGTEVQRVRPKQKVSRAGLLKMAGISAAAATAVGLDLTSRGGTALASDGNAVSAGRETKAEHGTTVTYNGASGLTGAVLLGNDSTYGNGGFNYPAAVSGIAGAGGTAGDGGLVNGMYAFTDNGAGNGIVGYNSNSVAGAGNGVLGVAFSNQSNGVHGTNTTGTAVLGESGAGTGVWGTSGQSYGVLGQAHNPANYAAGVKGTHDGATGGIGVYGRQTGAGWGGYFTSVSGRGVVAGGGTGVGVYADGKSAAVQAYGGSYGVDAHGTIAVSATGTPDGAGVNASGGVNGVVASGGTTGVTAYGPTAVLAEGSGIGVYGLSSSTAANAWAVQGEVTSTSPNGLSAGVFGLNDSATGKGMGVFGKHAGSGQGGHFQSAQGVGVLGDGGAGRGGSFTGSTAALRLVPGSGKTHPVSGQAGDLYVDSTHRLWFCQQGGTHATWKQIA